MCLQNGLRGAGMVVVGWQRWDAVVELLFGQQKASSLILKHGDPRGAGAGIHSWRHCCLYCHIRSQKQQERMGDRKGLGRGTPARSKMCLSLERTDAYSVQRGGGESRGEVVG